MKRQAQAIFNGATRARKGRGSRPASGHHSPSASQVAIPGYNYAPDAGAGSRTFVQSGGAWRAVVAITRGGMAPAMIVARELDIRTVDTISVKSYHAGGGKADKQREAEVLKSPDAVVMGDGEGVLIVDDLVDTGKTLELVRQLYPKAHFATIYAKPKGEPMVDTFITGVSQDTWIFFPWDMALQYVEPYRGKD